MGCGVAATLWLRCFLRIQARRLDAPDPDRQLDPLRPPISEPGLELEPPAVLGRRVVAGVHGVSITRGGAPMRGHSVS